MEVKTQGGVTQTEPGSLPESRRQLRIQGGQRGQNSVTMEKTVLPRSARGLQQSAIERMHVRKPLEAGEE